MTDTNSTTATTETIGFTKAMPYDADTRDFYDLVNGQILDWVKTLLQIQELCNEYVFESLRRGNVDAADLTSEDATNVLLTLTQVDAEGQTRLRTSSPPRYHV